MGVHLGRHRRRGATHLNPLPPNLGDLLKGYRHVLVPELNMGQLCRIVRANYLVDAKAVTKVQGLPFTSAEIERAIQEALS
jgi:pyruvate/2-oxoacid:ferredoxin oxidoreductase alpha subunit